MTREEAIEFGNMWLEMNEDCKDSSTYAFFHMAIKALKQEPCTNAISRQAAIDACLNGWNKDYKEIVEEIRALPPIIPQYTDAEIQKMQDLEFAEIQKAYEIGKAKGSEVLDKIRAEIDEQYDRVHPYNISCAEGLEMALEIIDKYKASPTGEEVEE